uniref:Uncharacterized protein n=1 Tax=Oryza barthii TaxID=65489 RepID=A0A0D3FHW0_9ORYZ
MNLKGSVVDEGGGTTVELIHSGERLDGLGVTVDRGLRGNECRERHSERRKRNGSSARSNDGSVERSTWMVSTMSSLMAREWGSTHLCNATLFLASSPAATCTDAAAHLIELHDQIYFDRVISATTDAAVHLVLPMESPPYLSCLQHRARRLRLLRRFLVLSLAKVENREERKKRWQLRPAGCLTAVNATIRDI